MRGLMRALVPLERLVEVRYRVCRHQKEPMHVLGLGGEDVSLDALKRFTLVDAGCAHQDRAGTQTEGAGEAFGEAVRGVLGRAPGLEEVEVWSEDGGLPARLVRDDDLPVPASATALSRMVVHRSGGLLRDEDAAAALRDRVADVAVCRGSCSCTPSMEIPGTDIDWVDSPFEW